MAAVVTDTHALVWYLVEPKKLSSAAKDAFEQATDNDEPIYFSAITLVELRYLIERGRLSQTVMDSLLDALTHPDTSLEVVPLSPEIAIGIGKVSGRDVPDMPDRIIAATAVWLGLPLVTRDHKIIASGISTIW
jgi:PIN domain nuclease of toxin-antitoxin system